MSKLIKKLEEIRDLLSSQENKECLGVGTDGHQSNWPIVDEVIDSLTKIIALINKRQITAEQLQAIHLRCMRKYKKSGKSSNELYVAMADEINGVTDENIS